MATRLKGTDVVVIGLGAAGGVAVLPLAQAGLEVIGLDATTCGAGRCSPATRPIRRRRQCARRRRYPPCRAGIR